MNLSYFCSPTGEHKEEGGCFGSGQDAMNGDSEWGVFLPICDSDIWIFGCLQSQRLRVSV